MGMETLHDAGRQGTFVATVGVGFLNLNCARVQYFLNLFVFFWMLLKPFSNLCLELRRVELISTDHTKFGVDAASETLSFLVRWDFESFQGVDVFVLYRMYLETFLAKFLNIFFEFLFNFLVSLNRN